ncbi:MULTISPECIES: hypothetical protein [Legionella]|uniref:Transmembrane protein n=1 Tax=Legionella donaldsonii TaxID=45060 RepID=A0A378J6H2_9GAMM|nr:hypothetical protein [Legionella donaldsonii]STX43215.1 Uncharacterised protein [Legionella donaldsonii]
MAKESVVVTEHSHCSHTYKRISWSAIVIGALVAVGLNFLLNLFGLAIGLSAFTMSDAGASTVVIGGMLGILIGIIAAMLAAGYAAGYLGRLYCPQRNLGILYGFSTWTLALILSALITMPLTHHVTNYTKMASPSISVITKKSMDTGKVVSAATVSPASHHQNIHQKAMNVTAPTETTAWSVFCVFILFFISALSCCFGACWGMSCCRED